MKIVEIAPINKGIFKDNLSYFTNLDLPLGAIVTIPVKNREVNGLVLSIKRAEDIKSQLKSSEFGLKKVTRLKSTNLVMSDFIDSASVVADYFASPLSQILKSLIPQVIIEKADDLKKRKNSDQDELPSNCEKMVIQEPEEERLSFYKSLIREAFAKKQSIFLCLPSSQEVENVSDIISKGIENFVATLHGKMTKNQIVSIWEKITDSEHPLLIIGTPIFLSIPRADIKIIIVDRENSSAYRTLNRPFFDYRFLVEKIAEKRKIKVIFGDTVLRSETIFRVGRNEFTPATPLKYRLYSEIKPRLVSLNQDKQTPAKIVRSSLSEELLVMIENSREQNERLLIFSGRRGLAPVVTCNDCGTIVACEICHSPLSLHQNSTSQNSERIFICHKCGQIVEVEDKCRTCGGWRLAVIGYGLEKLEEEIKEKFPSLNIFRLDSDTVKSSKKAKETINNFISSPGSVLLGTEMVLNYINEQVENVAVANIDAFFAIPDFRISEKLFNLILRLRAIARKRFLIQTRNQEEKVFTYISAGNLLDFFRDEIAERKKFGYPPFKTIIKISLNGRKDFVIKKIKELEERLKNYSPLIFPAVTKQPRGDFLLHVLIKLDSEHWIDSELLAILKSLPPFFVIKVDPESILY